jgi:hypothetical protein
MTIRKTPKPKPRAASDLELLRRHEPIVRYTTGETFFPLEVGTYLAHATLWERDANGQARVLAKPGQLTPANIGELVADVEGRTFLNVATEASAADMARAILPGQRVQAEGFRRGPGRLARVGYLSRLADALFAGSLLLRGRVPGGIARSSALWYRATAPDGPHPYYGRVLRDAGWTVLQYWFFYAYNDWRSAFHGANDHEADWEQITLFLSSEDEGAPVPRWAAFAQHDYHGEALRRRWDDAEQLQVVDGHPVVFAGAGSHASYFVPGEYLAEQELRLPRWMHLIAGAIGRLFPGEGADRGQQRLVPIAFVDYARGDGVSIGPGQAREWSPVLLDETQTWAFDYAGLWGVSIQDPFEGEDAPAGPVYNRDGSVRGSWFDPLGFSGLDRVPPPEDEVQELVNRAEGVAAERQALSSEIDDIGRQLVAAGAELEAIRHEANLQHEAEQVRAQIAELRERNRRQRLALTETHTRGEAIERRRERLASGIVDAPRAHVTRIATPTPAGSVAYGRVLELWAALSIGLLLIGLVVALLAAPAYGVIAAIILIAAFVFIESVLRGTVVALVNTVSVALALIASVILAIHFWVPLVIAGAIVAGVFVIAQNLRELG